MARGESYIDDVPGKELRAVVERRLVSTTTSLDAVAELDVSW